MPESESSSDGEEEEVDEDSKGDSDSLDAFKAESPIQIRSCSLASGPLEVISEARSSSDNDDPNDPENGEVNKAFAKEESGGGYLTMSNSPGEQLPGIRILVRDETEEILVSTGLKAEMMDLLEKRLGPADATSAGSGELRETLEKSSELNCGSGSPGNSNPVGPQLRNVKLKPADSRPVSSSTLEVLKPIAVELNADPEHKRSSFYAEIEVLAEEEEEPKQQDGVSSGGEEEII